MPPGRKEAVLKNRGREEGHPPKRSPHRQRDKFRQSSGRVVLTMARAENPDAGEPTVPAEILCIPTRARWVRNFALRSVGSR